MTFITRPNFDNRQIVQYNNQQVDLYGITNISPTILDFTGTTTGQSTVNIMGLTGYLNEGRGYGFRIKPPLLSISGSTGYTTVDVTGYVLTSLDSGGTVTWSPLLSGNTDTFVTGGTLSGTNLVLGWNNGNFVNPIDLSSLSGSSFTGNTSATCVTDLYISNLYGCSPITIHDSVQAIGTSATGLLSFSWGFKSKSIGNYSHAEGSSSEAQGLASHAEGGDTVSSGNYSHAEGNLTTASGPNSHAEGNLTTASGEHSHAEGFQTFAVGQAAHTEGWETSAIGNRSHAEGANTVASGDTSHAEGNGSQSIGVSSHAEGYQTVADGNYSHAEGLQTLALDEASHAEGSVTQAIGASSHAEGSGTQSIGIASHAEGINTISNGDYSHAGGFNSVASGLTSFVHSTNSTVLGDRSVILGGSNITGSANNTVYVPFLNIREDKILHSNTKLELSDISNISNVFKGSYTEFNWTGLTSTILSNTNPNGYTSILLGDTSGFPTTHNYGFLSYYGSSYTRTGSPITGVNFYSNKLTLKGGVDSGGLVINPKANDPEGVLWVEVGDSSVIKLKGDGLSGATLGLALNPDGTEDATSTLQIGGTGTTGTFRYIDGNQQLGYVLTSDNDGNATWGPASGITSTNIYNSDGVISNTSRLITLNNSNLNITGDPTSIITSSIVSPGVGGTILQLDDITTFNGYFELTPSVASVGFLAESLETSLNYYDGLLTGDRTTIRVSKGAIIAQSQDPIFEGIKYNTDYSANYDPRSLVDKEYVDKLLNSYGQVSITTGGTINITTAGTYQSTGLVGTLNIENNGVSLGTTDTLAIKNTSGKEQLFKIYASADINAGNNKRLGIKLALNGTPIDETECNAPTGTGTSFAKLITNWMIRLQPNDEVALWVTNFTNTGNVTLERARIVADTII